MTLTNRRRVFRVRLLSPGADEYVGTEDIDAVDDAEGAAFLFVALWCRRRSGVFLVEVGVKNMPLVPRVFVVEIRERGL